MPCSAIFGVGGWNHGKGGVLQARRHKDGRVDHKQNLLTKMKLKQHTDSGSNDSPCSRFRNPWGWKFNVGMLAISYFTAGMSAASWIRDGDGAITTITSLFTAVLAGFMVRKGYEWERDNSSANAKCAGTDAGAQDGKHEQ